MERDNKIVTLTEEYSKYRENYQNIYDRTNEIVSEIEGKFLTYIKSRETLASIYNVAELLSGLSSAQRIMLDASDKLSKSVEKEIELRNKHIKEDGEITYEDIQLIAKAVMEERGKK